MRIFGFEIHRTRAAPNYRTAWERVWHNPPYPPKRILDMTPEELRNQLAAVVGHLAARGMLHITPRDPHQRIQFVNRKEVVRKVE